MQGMNLGGSWMGQEGVATSIGPDTEIMTIIE